LGGGYLFGLPLGFVADSAGATIGATAAFLLGRTVGKSYVMSKLKNYPKFQAVTIAIQKSGFKPITFAFVYVGTTLKDLSDVTHGWNEVSTTRLVIAVFYFIKNTMVLITSITRIARTSLDKALAENADIEYDFASDETSKLPTTIEKTSNLWQPLVIKVDPSREHLSNN
ncbi:hypothetical protein RDABS01_025680, partial [Bienertia sinuspersici]